MLEDGHERLAGVADFIDRYDRPGTLFYLDPQYFGSEDDYGNALFATSSQPWQSVETASRALHRVDKRRSGDP